MFNLHLKVGVRRTYERRVVVRLRCALEVLELAMNDYRVVWQDMLFARERCVVHAVAAVDLKELLAVARYDIRSLTVRELQHFGYHAEYVIGFGRSASIN